MAIATKEPASIIQGDTVKWTRNEPDFLPSASWVLTYTFTNSNQQQSFTATDNGDETHLVTISATASALFKIGVYHWQAKVAKSGETFTVDSGTIEVKQDLVTEINGFDSRTHVKTMLDAIELALEGKATDKDLDLLGFNIRDRGQTRDVSKLIALRSKYRIEYQRELDAEKIANGEGLGNKVLMRF